MIRTRMLLQIVLVLFGVTCCLLYPLAIVWPMGHMLGDVPALLIGATALGWLAYADTRAQR